MAINIEDYLQTAAAIPHITVLYGVAGIGKTTFASQAPNPVFLMCEDGLVTAHLQKMPYLASKGRRTIQTYDEMIGWLDALTEAPGKFKTVVIDSLSAFEDLVTKKVISEGRKTNVNISSIADFGHGKGYAMMDQYWLEFMEKVKALREIQNISVILICHSQIKPVNQPDTETYDRFEPALSKRTWPIVTRVSDNVLFARTSISTKEKEGGFSKQFQAVGEGERRLYCTEKATHVAKNRCDMPAYIPMQFDQFSKFVPFMSTEKAKESV